MLLLTAFEIPEMKIRQVIFLIIFSFIAGFQAFAQTGIIRGFVVEKSSGEPIIFTNVYLKGTSYGASTDVNGYFSITKIKPGSYMLMVTSLGYDTLKENVQVVRDKILDKKLQLSKKSVEMSEVQISAAKSEAKKRVQISVSKVTPKEIESIPTVGGSPDIVQYLQVLPGVVFTGDQGGQLYIRGGTPIQNEVLLDGMTIYNPFHSIGLFSVFNTDIIRNADVYTGGFGPQYGGRISSVMDITTIDGNKKRVSGSIGASTFLTEATIQGPIKKQKDGGGSITYVFSGKHSYLDQTSKSLYSYIDSKNGLPYSFTDLYGKITFGGENGNKFSVFGFDYNDKVNYQDVSNLSWKATGGGANFVLTPSRSAVLISGHFSLSNYDIKLEEAALAPRESSINDFNLKFDFKYFSGDNELRYGISALGFNTTYNFFNSIGRQINNDKTNTQLGAYFNYRANIHKKLVLNVGIRAILYSTLQVFSPEPRISAKYNVSDKLRLKFAGGKYSQNLIAANSDRDVVNLFYGFLAGPDNLPSQITLQNGTTKDILNPLQKAWHAILGLEYDLTPNLNLNLEGYYKKFGQLTNSNRNKIYDESRNGVPDILKKNFIVETGNAKGLDMTLKYSAHHANIWLVYSLGYVSRWDGITAYNPVFDRRHNINFVASYSFGKGHTWEASARWNFGSGFPFTQTQGAYLQSNFGSGINSSYITDNSNNVTLQLGELNKGRLPTYHRLDLSLKRTFNFSEYSSLVANVGVTNVYNRKNVFYVNRITGKVLYQLPIIPSVGLTFKF